MHVRLRTVGLCSVFLFSYTSLHAQGTALTLKAGTLGLGLEVTRSITSTISGRIGASLMNYYYSGQTHAAEPIAYDLELTVLAYTALFDYYPLNNNLRFCGGIIYNAMKIDGTGNAVNEYEFDSKVYTPEDIGTLAITAEPSVKFAPYLGIGFGNTVAANAKFNFVLDIGLLYMGAPEVSLTADEDALLYPTTTQEGDIEEDIKNLKFYPVVTVGFGYRF